MTIEEVIWDCIKKDITDKKTIGREAIKVIPGMTLDQARDAIRNILGAKGRPVAQKNLEVYNAYIEAVSKTSHYAVASKKELKDSPVYIITSAMNGAPVYKPFWDKLLEYVDFRKAELHVVAMRYKNVTSLYSDLNNDVWVPEVIPYLDANNHQLFDDVQLLSRLKIVPTASMPLSGLNGITGEKSCIVGHTRSHMLCVPALPGCPVKKMMTTGSCTEKNYTDTKAGRVGEHHHVYGFVIVTENDMHQVVASSDGSFIDYEWQVDDSGIHPAPPAKAIVFGDVHRDKIGEFEINRMIQRIRGTRAPVVVVHDVFDGISVSPHVEKNAIEKVRRHHQGKDSLTAEIDEALDLLSLLKDECEELLLVASNHENFLDRYIASMQWQKDTNNAMKYAELLPIALREEVGVFPYLASLRGITALTLNDSYKICGIELAIHGHLGTAGSRGSVSQFKNLSVKSITGHTHSPSMIDGCTTVGVQSLDHGYNRGLSSWSVGDCVVNADGKRQFIFE